MKKRFFVLGLCMMMTISACSVKNNSQEDMPVTEEELEEQAALEEQDPDLVLLEEGNDVEICNGELIAEMQKPYSGMFWENQTHEEVSDVCYVKFTNCTDFMIESADISLGDNEGELYFHIDMLKPGESVFVAEADKQMANGEELRYVDSNITYLESKMVVTDSVNVEMQNGKEFKVTNLTGNFLPLLQIYYGPYDEQNVRVSGRLYAKAVDGLDAKQELDVTIDGWDEACQIVDIISVAE